MIPHLDPQFAPPTNLNWKQYVGVTIPFSVGTIWVMIALQHKMNEPSLSIIVHLLWPFSYLLDVLQNWRDGRLLPSATTVVVDPTLDIAMLFPQESIQEDGKDTSRARVTRYWGWRPQRGGAGIAHSTRAASRATLRSHSDSRHSLPIDASAAAAMDRFIDAYERQNEKPWSKARFRRIFSRKARMQAQRADTLSAL